MKKISVLFVSVLLITTCWVGCTKFETANQADSKRLSVVSTIFPGYDFAKQICGDNADVTILLPPGLETHSYEPSARDIIKIQNCDLFIYVGGQSDKWVDSILENVSDNVKTVKMLDCVDVVEQETVAGMEFHDDHTGHDHEPDINDNQSAEYDEHVWTSPQNAVAIAQLIMEIVCSIDTEYSTLYQNNGQHYIEKLNQLDKNFEDFFATVQNRTMIFADRFPFRYFADRYNIKYSAAFPGCSTESEPSAKTIAFLIDEVKTQNISTIFYLEFSNHKLADSIAEATNVKTTLFHSCHNVSATEVENGSTYLSLMIQNLETLKGAMS